MDPVSVLVVDDEPGIGLLCKRMLARAGYFVTALTNPREAIDWLAQNKADLLLVDIRMPEVDGFEVITHARRLQPDLAVLVMTGFGTVETAIRALRQGVDGLILKPFEKSAELVEAAKQALADSQQKRDAARIHALRPLFEVTKSLLSEAPRIPARTHCACDPRPSAVSTCGLLPVFGRRGSVCVPGGARQNTCRLYHSG